MITPMTPNSLVTKVEVVETKVDDTSLSDSNAIHSLTDEQEETLLNYGTYLGKTVATGKIFIKPDGASKKFELTDPIIIEFNNLTNYGPYQASVGCYGDGKYFVFSSDSGYSGYYSTDGVNWNYTESFPEECCECEYAFNKFWLSSTEKLYSTTDFQTFTEEHTLAFSLSWATKNLLFVNGYLIASGRTGYEYTSDGTDWTSVETNTLSSIYNGTYFNNKYYFATQNGTFEMSALGETPTKISSLSSWNCNIASGNGKIVTFDDNGISYSTNGETWNHVYFETVPQYFDYSYEYLYFVNGVFLLFSPEMEYYSYDAINWNKLNYESQMSSLTINNKVDSCLLITYDYMSYDTTVKKCLTTQQWVSTPVTAIGDPWTTHYDRFGSSMNYTGAYINGTMVVPGGSHAIQYCTDLDEFTWTTVSIDGGTDNMYNIIAYNNKFYLASNRKIYESSDGINWSAIQTLSDSLTSQYSNCLWNVGGYIFFCSSNKNLMYATSPSGTFANIGSSVINVNCITECNGYLIISSYNNGTWRIAKTSGPGSTWTKIDSKARYGLSTNINNMVVGANRTDKTMDYSLDAGTTWNKAFDLKNENESYWGALTSANKFFYFFGCGDRFFMSDDGINWRNTPMGEYTYKTEDGCSTFISKAEDTVYICTPNGYNGYYAYEKISAIPASSPIPTLEKIGYSKAEIDALIAKLSS